MINRMNNTGAITLTEYTYETLCGHEAAHVVMRWIMGLPATNVEVGDNGGFTHGTGKTCDAKDILCVILAGHAYESGCGLAKVNFQQSYTSDLQQAKELLNECWSLRLQINMDAVKPEPYLVDVEEALPVWFDRACDLLFQHLDLVEIISERLQEKQVLFANEVADICKEYEKLIEIEAA